MLILDAHVHVYPFYDEAALLEGAVARLSALAAPGDSLGIVLVEREGVDVFGKWASGGVPEKWPVTQLDDRTLRLASPLGKRIHVFAGRQVACAERLEILGIGCRTPVEDGVPCEKAIAAIEKDGGLPALAWGVGKWMFGRAGVVKRLLRDHGPEELALCDTSLRPVVWPMPAAMRDGIRPVLCGSDPLPKAGEEAQAGRYACDVSLMLPAGDPAKQLVARIRVGGLRPLGRRSSVAEFLKRH